MRILSSIVAAMAIAVCGPALAQEAKGLPSMTLHDVAAKWMMQQDDIADVGRYREENRSLPPPHDGVARVILFGDSLTYHWPAELLPQSRARAFINRGIPGQNSSQLVLRFQSDVVELKPDAVVILVGTNDLRVYLGDPSSAKAEIIARLMRNLAALIDMARAHGITPILCTIPPFGNNPALQRDLQTLTAANHAIRAMATDRKLMLADYNIALPATDGYLPPDIAKDGLHFGSAGYELLELSLDQTLGRVNLTKRRTR